MPFKTPEEDLLFNLKYAISSFHHAQPRKKDRQAMEVWRAWLAKHVFEHLQQAGFEIRAKEPPPLDPAISTQPKE